MPYLACSLRASSSFAWGSSEKSRESRTGRKDRRSLARSLAPRFACHYWITCSQVTLFVSSPFLHFLFCFTCKMVIVMKIIGDH